VQGFGERLKEQPAAAEATGLLMPVTRAGDGGTTCSQAWSRSLETPAIGKRTRAKNPITLPNNEEPVCNIDPD